MNALRIVILLFAVTAAGATAFLVQRMVAGGEGSDEGADERVLMSAVLVAARPVEVGRKLGAEDLAWREWPQEAVAQGFITRDRTPDAASSLAGHVTRVPIAPGEPIFLQKLVKADAGGFLAAVLAPGMRAMSIEISAETGAGGFILPNDRVDVILTVQTSGDAGEDAIRSETILRDIRVLAIDQSFEQIEGKQVAVGKTATLEVTPNQVEALALAVSAGVISLSLRSIADQGVKPDVTGAVEEDIKRRTGITVVRYGVPQRISVRATEP